VELHNIMEDMVQSIVADIFSSETRTKALGFCTCFQCQQDVACYVLNRLQPEYVFSGRGVAYSSKDYQEKIQKQADAITLANEGWRKIEQSKRPHCEHGTGRPRPDYPRPPVFNYPTIIGRLFNGSTFDPMDGMRLTLLRNGEETRMIDPNWQNPCSLFASTGGTFIFWPYPDEAHAEGESKVVEFEIRASHEGFEDFEHFFTLRVSSENAVQDQFSLQRQFVLPDLTIFPK
jgi:competence protein ComFB